MRPKCKCNRAAKASCPNCSQYKLVILLRKGYHDKKDARGNPINPVWYSFFKEEKFGIEGVFARMAKRALEKFGTKYYRLQLYENNQLIKQYP